MRSRFLFSLLLSLPLLSIGQSNASIDFLLSVDYSYRTINSDQLSLDILEVKELESGKINWRAGFNYNHKLTDQFFIKTGLRFASIGYQLNRTDLQLGSQTDGNGGFNPDAEGLNYNYNYFFLETPLILRLESKEKKKVSPFLEGGFSGMFYLTTQMVEIEGSSKSISFKKEILPEFNTFQLALNFSAGLNITPNDQWQFFVQPIFRYHLTRISEYPIEEHLWSAGLEMGCRKKLY